MFGISVGNPGDTLIFVDPSSLLLLFEFGDTLLPGNLYRDDS
jgi:hypothetical protein